MNTTHKSLVIFDELMIVTLDGFESEPEHVDGYRVDLGIDLPGSANFLCERYGMAGEDFATDPDASGILWSDYDDSGWRFSVLIQSDQVESLTECATEAGYTVVKTEAVSKPTNYGDGTGTVEILRHRDGWVILD